MDFFQNNFQNTYSWPTSPIQSFAKINRICFEGGHDPSVCLTWSHPFHAFSRYSQRTPKCVKSSQNVNLGSIWKTKTYIGQPIRADSRFAPSQWETALLCNGVSHWLAPSLASALVNSYLHNTLTWFLIRSGIKAMKGQIRHIFCSLTWRFKPWTQSTNSFGVTLKPSIIYHMTSRGRWAMGDGRQTARCKRWGDWHIQVEIRWPPFLHTTFSNEFLSMNIVVFWLKFHWNMLAMVQLTIIQHWFR